MTTLRRDPGLQNCLGSRKLRILLYSQCSNSECLELADTRREAHPMPVLLVVVYQLCKSALCLLSHMGACKIFMLASLASDMSVHVLSIKSRHELAAWLGDTMLRSPRGQWVGNC